jgi:hypothetical protein
VRENGYRLAFAGLDRDYLLAKYKPRFRDKPWFLETIDNDLNDALSVFHLAIVGNDRTSVERRLKRIGGAPRKNMFWDWLHFIGDRAHRPAGC